MARRGKRRYSRRRSGANTHRRSHKWTAGKVVKYLIAFGPVTGAAIADTQAAGGFNATGISRGLVPRITKTYAFINSNTGQIDTTGALLGYPMIIAGVIAGRVIGRFFK